MKCQSLFSGKNKKNISKSCLKFLPSMLSVRKGMWLWDICNWDNFLCVRFVVSSCVICLIDSLTNHHENIPIWFWPPPHFYIVKLGFTGVYIIFLISAQKHWLWVLVRTASLTEAVLTMYVLSRNMKTIGVFLSENFQVLEVKFSIYLNRHVFVMICGPHHRKRCLKGPDNSACSLIRAFAVLLRNHLDLT